MNSSAIAVNVSLYAKPGYAIKDIVPILQGPTTPNLTTEVFFSGDPYLDSDAIFGVRESLVMTVAVDQDAALAKRYKLTVPFHSVTFDFRLGR